MLFYTAYPGTKTGTFSPKNIKFEQIQTKIDGDLSAKIVSDYGLNDNNGRLSLKSLTDRVTTIESQNSEFNGEKTFKKIPTCDARYDASTVNPDGYSLPNVNYVKQLIEDNGSYISETSYIMGDPNNESPYTTDSDYFLHFRIDDGGRDSSEFVTTTGETAGYEKCPYTGQLVIYGWLADQGGVMAQDAWVGLYGLMNVINENQEMDQKWTLLQVQPWIIGSKSSIMQYVSFNIPVSSGMKLKIRTGFRVDGTNSGFAQPNALTYTSWQPNSFVGYVIQNN